MLGILTEPRLFFLQSFNYKLFKDDDPKQGMILLIAVGAIILFSVMFHIFRNGISTSGMGRTKSRTGSVTPRKFNAFALYRIASSYGLDRDQTKLLEYVFRIDSVADPERVMSNPALLDRHFRRAYKAIGRNSESEEDAQQRLVKLFSLRNIIEAAPGMGGTTTTSSHIAENTPAVLVCDKDSYPVKVLSSRGQNIVVDIPRNALGTPVRLSRGTRVSLSFFTKSSKGFSFDGHIVGAVDTNSGPGLQILHTGKVKPLVKRMYRRKQATIRCEFFMVFLDESGGGRKKTQKLVVDSKRFTGNVLDVSIGGCSIKTTASVQVGSRLKITIDYSDNYLINVLGQVLRANRSGPTGSIIHIKFLKVPRRAFNSINAFVFGYDEE